MLSETAIHNSFAQQCYMSTCLIWHHKGLRYSLMSMGYSWDCMEEHYLPSYKDSLLIGSLEWVWETASECTKCDPVGWFQVLSCVVFIWMDIGQLRRKLIYKDVQGHMQTPVNPVVQWATYYGFKFSVRPWLCISTKDESPIIPYIQKQTHHVFPNR